MSTNKKIKEVSIEEFIEAVQKQARQDLRKHLLKMHPQKFEELIRSLLEEMGFDEAETSCSARNRHPGF